MGDLRAKFFGGASRVMFGHGLADLRNYVNGQNSRARPAKNYHVLSKFPGLTAHDQPDRPPLLRAEPGPTHTRQDACFCLCMRCFFYSPLPPSPV